MSGIRKARGGGVGKMLCLMAWDDDIIYCFQPQHLFLKSDRPCSPHGLVPTQPALVLHIDTKVGDCVDKRLRVDEGAPHGLEDALSHPSRSFQSGFCPGSGSVPGLSEARSVSTLGVGDGLILFHVYLIHGCVVERRATFCSTLL